MNKLPKNSVSATVEFDHKRGTVYVHFCYETAQEVGLVTFIRIQGLPSPIPCEMIDVRMDRRVPSEQ
jgi:hypothetical protein